MPLIKSKKKSAFKKNIKTEIKTWKPVKQAVAIAYSLGKETKKGYQIMKGKKLTKFDTPDKKHSKGVIDTLNKNKPKIKNEIAKKITKK